MANQRTTMMTDRRGRWLGIMLLLAGPAGAAEPCPWEADSKACEQWDALVQRLEAAEQRAATAEAKLKAVMDALQPPPESVAEPDPEAARVRTIIAHVLENLSPPTAGFGRLEIDPDYSLRRDGETHRTTISRAAGVLGERRLDFGPLALSVRPLPNDVSEIDLRIGSTLYLRNKGTITARIEIGQQHTQGRWNEALKIFNQAHIRLQDLKLTGAGDESAGITLGNLNVTRTLDVGKDGHWSNKQSLELTDLTIEADSVTLRIGRIRTRFQLDGRQHPTWLRLREQPGPSPNAPDQGPLADETLLTNLSRSLDLISHSNAKATIADVSISEPGQPLAGIAQLTMGGRFDRDNTDHSAVSYTLGVDGLKIHSPRVPPELAPRSARLALDITHIPPRLVTQIAEIGIAGEKIEDTRARQAYMSQELLTLLMVSRLELSLSDSFIEAAAARIDLALASTFDPDASMGTTGDFTLRFEGLQRIMDALNATDQEGVGPVLAILTVFSNRTREDGKIIDSYTLEITPEGEVRLNGKDITALVTRPQPRP